LKVFEINNDAKMKRTMRRPLPSGRVSSTHAAMWATLWVIGQDHQLKKFLIVC
jgi:heme O synthase-like polyprenyltransferase